MWTKSRCLAIFSLCLYTFDVGSDGFVGGDLIWKCHHKYGISVFCLVLLPGFIWGWLNLGRASGAPPWVLTFGFGQCRNGLYGLQDTLKAMSGPFWFIPNGWWKLLQAVIHDGDKRKLEDAKM